MFRWVASTNFLKTKIIPGRLRRTIHFASSQYASCFGNLPKIQVDDIEFIRQCTIDYMKYKFDPNLWYHEPIVSLLKGKELKSDDNPVLIDTKDALGIVNGKQIHANRQEIELIKHHIMNYTSSYKDLRKPIRQIEYLLLHEPHYISTLIGNQCHDFYKQDGITEMEESILANHIERRLNDLLLDEYETNGIIKIQRKPIYVASVSNFSNFLDLFRKTIRSLEIGIPVIILCRSNTSQHTYRWAKLLQDLLLQQNSTNNAEMYVDPGMITFLSCSLPDMKSIVSECANHTGNLYATCSRELAKEMKLNYYNTIASTGGPNTLIYTKSTSSSTEDQPNEEKMNQQLYDAIRISSSIECAGQCTALRHVVVPTTISHDQIDHVFRSNDLIKEIPSPLYALENRIFTGIYRDHEGSSIPPTNEYVKSNDIDAYYKIHDINTLPESSKMNEYWRKVVVDFSKLDINEDHMDSIYQLAKWLRINQPISLAINGKRHDSIVMGIKLWELTSLVVNTIGSVDHHDTMPPALSCQARPQDGEVFGEFPPRNDMISLYTKFPMIIPSSNPSYDSHYTTEYLHERYHHIDMTSYSKEVKDLLLEISNESRKGYCIEIMEYIRDACRMNPKLGYGTARTVLYGLQRPPLHTISMLRCSATTTWDDIAPIVLLFRSTTARNQFMISIDPANDVLISFFMKHNLLRNSNTNDMASCVVIESDGFEQSTTKMNNTDIFHTIHMDHHMMKHIQSYPLAGQFVSLFLPTGHLKSTIPNDQEFTLKARLSKKWLNSLF